MKRLAPHLLLVAAAVTWPFLTPAGAWFSGALAVSYAFVALSLVVLSGWTGQISLGQAAFYGFGVYLVRPILDAGVPALPALLVVGAAGAAISLVLGVPSLRLRGVYLAIATLAFGAMCQNYLFNQDIISGGTASQLIPRPAGLESTRAFYLATLLPLGIALLVVGQLRRSDVGRVLIAMRDSENAAQALGVRLASYKIGVFAFSAGLACIGGALYGMLIGATPSGTNFGVLQSWFFLAMPVVGGLRSISGAVVGGALFAAAQPLTNELGIRLYLTSGLLVIVVLLSRSDGIVGLLRSLRAGFRRELAGAEERRLARSTRPAPARLRLTVEDEVGTPSRLRLVRAQR
ncbi:MAG: branched-chain amino acid ABC transporter permease [Mycobacteriales bacterium]